MVESDAVVSCVTSVCKQAQSTRPKALLKMDPGSGGPVIDAVALAPVSRSKTGPKLYDVISLGDLCVDVLVTTDEVSSHGFLHRTKVSVRHCR